MERMTEKVQDGEARSAVEAVPAVGLPVLNSESLLKGGSEVLIEHGSCIYSLRVTRQGKLILTK